MTPTKIDFRTWSKTFSLIFICILVMMSLIKNQYRVTTELTLDNPEVTNKIQEIIIPLSSIDDWTNQPILRHFVTSNIPDLRLLANRVIDDQDNFFLEMNTKEETKEVGHFIRNFNTYVDFEKFKITLSSLIPESEIENKRMNEMVSKFSKDLFQLSENKFKGLKEFSIKKINVTKKTLEKQLDIHRNNKCPNVKQCIDLQSKISYLTLIENRIEKLRLDRITFLHSYKKPKVKLKLINIGMIPMLIASLFAALIISIYLEFFRQYLKVHRDS